MLHDAINRAAYAIVLCLLHDAINRAAYAIVLCPLHDAINRAAYAMALCPSVCLSVQMYVTSCIVWKWLNMSELLSPSGLVAPAL